MQPALVIVTIGGNDLRNLTLEQYKTIMLDEFHLNAKGHAVFGALCCASLELPFPEWPAQDKPVIEQLLEAVQS